MVKEEIRKIKKADKDVENIVFRTRNRRRGDDNANSTSIWLISFTDVMALMLTFFVLLFAMSNPDREQWERITQNIQQSVKNFQGEQYNRGQEDDVNIAKIDFNRALNLRYLKALIENLIENEPNLNAITIMQSDDRLILSIPQELLFLPGTTTIQKEGTMTLYTLVNTLRRIKNRVEIIGHTDPRPIQASEYESNWELSLARAASVAGKMETVGYDSPIVVKGYAGGRYNDIPASVPEGVRMELSRRVDIVIREDDGKKFELFDINFFSMDE